MLQSPKKRLRWINECTVRAIDAVKQGSSVKRAAEQHGVPRTMPLRDHISGHVQHEKKPGPESEEEEDLVNFIEEVAEVGFGQTSKQIKAMVEQTAHEKQVLRNKNISDGWLDVSCRVVCHIS